MAILRSSRTGTSRTTLVAFLFAAVVITAAAATASWRWAYAAGLADAATTELGKANSLLVTQQLDELFRTIEGSVQDDPLGHQTHAEALRVFEIFDKKFVEQNAATPGVADAEATVAAQRLVSVSKIFGRTDQTLTYLRQTINGLKRQVEREPDLFAVHLHDMVDAEIALGRLKLQQRENDDAASEFQEAYNLLSRPDVPDNHESSSWVVTQLQELARFGVELGNCHDANELADRAVEISERFANLLPKNAEWKSLLQTSTGFRTELRKICVETDT